MILSDSKKTYITNQVDLPRLISLIHKAKLVAIDTEFIRKTTYYPILSLIQLAVKNSSDQQELFIIDCLSCSNLSGIFAIISNPKITKIFHSASQDLEIFYHLGKEWSHNIVDTQVMANFCGFGYGIGYSALVEKLFQKQLDKKLQNSNWQKRPLSKEQIEYALIDVFFLQEAYQHFLKILEEKKRLSWFLEEMEDQVKKILTKSGSNPSKNFCFKKCTSHQIFLIKNLVSWREIQAQKLNVARRILLADEFIEEIVLRDNFNLNFSKKITDKMIDEIKKIVSCRKDEPEIKKPDYGMSLRQKRFYEEAKKTIGAIAKKEGFCEQFLISSADLKKIVCEKENFDQKISGWRHQIFGNELKNLSLK